MRSMNNTIRRVFKYVLEHSPVKAFDVESGLRGVNRAEAKMILERLTTHGKLLYAGRGYYRALPDVTELHYRDEVFDLSSQTKTITERVLEYVLAADRPLSAMDIAIAVNWDPNIVKALLARLYHQQKLDRNHYGYFSHNAIPKPGENDYIGGRSLTERVETYVSLRGPVDRHDVAKALECTPVVAAALLSRLHRRGKITKNDIGYVRRTDPVAPGLCPRCNKKLSVHHFGYCPKPEGYIPEIDGRNA
jgi:predicted transcriptional regulator of viral defense system